MTREQALRRLEQTSNFTFVGGRVLITDQRTLEAVAELRSEGAVANAVHMPPSRPMPTTTPSAA